MDLGKNLIQFSFGITLVYKEQSMSVSTSPKTH